MYLKGGINVLNLLLKLKYHWHLFRQHYNELLMRDCLNEEIKVKLKGKALYHHHKLNTVKYRLLAN
jgi:hypothetical protein